MTGAIGAVIGGIIGGIRAANSGGNVWAGALTGAAIGAAVGMGLGAVAGMALAGSALASTSAVVAGGGAFIGTLATGGLSAGATFLSNNLQASVGVTSQVTTAIQPYYPPNQGFAGTPQSITLEVGTILQRTGNWAGRYVAPAGTPQQMLSLPYNQLGQPTTYFQVCQPIRVLSGKVAPWFGQIGGGTQYILENGRVDQLLKAGILKIWGS